MADATHSSNPSRRSFLRGSPAAVVSATVGLSAMPTIGLIAPAIERHKARLAELDAHQGPDDVPDDIVDAETAAVDDLAATPCVSDGEFVEKLRYLTGYHKRMWGPHDGDCREIMTALSLHFSL